jgi:hypothetical protein
MAKNTAKANIKSNATRLLTFLSITIAVNVLHLAALWWTSGLPPSFWQTLGLAFWAGQEFVALKFLQARGAAAYDAEGRLEECIDLSDPAQLGLASYAQDLLWVCWGLQVLSNVVSSYFGFLYLAVPIYGVSKAWSTIISPLLSQRASMQAMAQQQQQQHAGGPPPDPNADPRNRLQRRREEARQGKKGRG